MLKWTPISLCALVLVTAQINVRADDRPADLNDNAALKYWRAFSLMPHLTHEEQDRLRREAQTAALDNRIKDLVSQSDAAFHELHHGAKLTHCAWSINVEDGVYLRLPEVQAARTLTDLGIYRIRLRFQEGRSAEALDTALDLIKLGRDASKGSTIIAVLVGIAVEAATEEAVAANLPRAHAAQLKDFSERWQKLPAMGTMAAAMLVGEERGFLLWFIREVEKCNDDDAVLKLLTTILAGQPGKDASVEAKAFFAGCGGSKEGVLQKTKEARPKYQEWATNMSLPLGEFKKFWENEKNEALAKNVVVKTMAPGLYDCRLAEARAEARRKLFKAALAVQLNGAEALTQHPDPFGDGPFLYTAFDGGFQLSSKLKHKKDEKSPETPVTLTVGKRNSG
jgi:hypothetical protein